MSDRLTFRGDRRVLSNAPLEPFLRGLPGKPDFRLRPEDGRNGYVAHWQIGSDDCLWLAGLDTRPPDQGPDPGLGLLFPEATGPVLARWVSMRLVSPDETEKRLTFAGTVPARELHLWVEKGRVLLFEEHRPGVGRRWFEFTRHLEGEYGADEAAFLRAAHAAPGDAAPRLVYADWLEERGDPRASVIRLGERLRALAPEAAARERAAHEVVLRHGRRQGLWVRILGYENLDVPYPFIGRIGL
jgi:uncharacterized protein (TIGR02996 family)